MKLLRFILFPVFGWFTILGASAVEIRIATYNVLTGIGGNGASGRTALEAVLNRIDADILSLQEITSADINNGHLNDLASNLGYGSVFVPVTALDTGSRVVILSKFPFISGSATSIVSPEGANDMTRAAAAAIVDVPGTSNDPIIVNAHLKCCLDPDDSFRRAVEMQRIRDYLDDLNIDGEDTVFIMGDFNLLGTDLAYTSIPQGLPNSYQLGNDISFNVRYYADPTRYFTGLGITNPGYRQQDGTTTDTFMGSDTILDHLLISSSVASRTPATEIYNSALESSFPGLPKSGTPLSSSTSSISSDHYPVFGDFDLDGGPTLDISVSPAVLDENSSPATVTITLSQPATAATTLTLQSSDPGEAVLGNTSIQILPGDIMATSTLNPLLDKISDGTQNLDILVSAPGFQGDLTSVSIRDADPQTYIFETPTQSILEDFEGFKGTQNPAAWRESGIIWIGSDDGSSAQFGARSYQGSLGILTASPITFQTTLRNESEQIIPALEITYDAQQWRRFTNGSADRIEFSMLRNDVTLRLPELDFQPSTSGLPGQVSPPSQSTRSTYLRNLALAPGEEVDIEVSVIPGLTTEETSDAVFINEFHYDNEGSDLREFIEVFVGSAYSGDLSNITIHLYNGNNNLAYGDVESLDTFIKGPSNGPGGPDIYYKLIGGIQNGAPDGIALAIDGVVREFLSYEGVLTAADGVAAGLVSTSVGVSQDANTPEGERSIARSGTGGLAEDFIWGIQPGEHTPGELNVGQTVGASPQPQGIAIDNFRITALADSDGDHLPDQEELVLGTNPLKVDSDFDGQSDFFESTLTNTDPLSGSSFFKTELLLGSDGVQVSFPSLSERSYRVETSTDLINWASSSAQSGTGKTLVFEFPRADTLFFRVRISLL